MESKDFYPLGSVFLFDALHVPYGCSVWPGFWTKAAVWPNGGEIDIVEQVNLATANQMTLHTAEGCTQDPGAKQTGKTVSSDCSGTAGNPTGGCGVMEQQKASFGAPFASNGGGVWATQFDETGIL